MIVVPVVASLLRGVGANTIARQHLWDCVDLNNPDLIKVWRQIGHKIPGPHATPTRLSCTYKFPRASTTQQTRGRIFYFYNIPSHYLVTYWYSCFRRVCFVLCTFAHVSWAMSCLVHKKNAAFHVESSLVVQTLRPRPHVSGYFWNLSNSMAVNQIAAILLLHQIAFVLFAALFKKGVIGTIVLNSESHTIRDSLLQWFECELENGRYKWLSVGLEKMGELLLFVVINNLS